MADANPVFDPLGALPQLSQDRMMQRMLDRQEQGFQQAQEQLGRVRQASESVPESYEAERYAAMALAAGKSPAVVGGMGQLLSNIGGAYGATLAAQKQRNFERELKMLDAIDKTAMPFGSGATTALLQAQLNPFTNVGGVGLVSKRTGQLAVPSNMVPEYNKLYAGFYKQATEQQMPNPEEWARQQAIHQLSAAMGQREVAGGRSTPLPTTPAAPGAVPAAGATPQPAEAPAPTAVKVPASATAPGVDIKDIDLDISNLERDIKWLEGAGKFQQAGQFREALKALKDAKAQVAPSAPATSAAPPPSTYKDTRASEFKKEWGGAEAKTLEKALTESSQTMGKSSQLLTTLNMLEGILDIDDMPEGQFAPLFVNAQSALKSLGVDIKAPTGPAQVALALGNEMALRLRTGGGENLMPGQMSNFDAQLLMSMAPSLSQTKEGRRMLLQIMRESAASQRRIAEEAQKFAAANKGVLTPEWRARAAELENVEIAKREKMRRQIMKQFGGGQ